MGSTVGGHEVPRLPLKTVGPYQLMAQLGQGAQGPIYVARIPGNEAVFALRLLPPNLPPEEVARIRQEIQVVARLDHEGLVRPVDVGLERGSLYVVTEHVAGSTVQELLSKNGPYPAREAALLVADLAAALHAAHQVGILHRDLKPGSVVVDGRSGRPRLTDLGLAPPADRGVPAGRYDQRPVYRAPELLRGERADARTDVYGLGAILYELLTCSPPFEGHSQQELCRNILAGDPEPPRALAGDVDPRVEAVVLKALAVAPKKRYADAAALEKALRRAASAGGGVSGSPLTLALAATIWLLTVLVPTAWAVRERSDRTQLQAELTAEAATAASLRSDLAVREDELATSREDLTQARSSEEQAQGRLRTTEANLSQLQQSAQRLQQAYQQLRQQVHQSLGVYVRADGQAGHAVDDLLDDLAAAPGTAALRSRLLRHRGQLPEAAEVARAAREAGDPDPELLILEYQAASMMGQRDQALALLEALEQVAAPDSAEAIYLEVVRAQDAPPGETVARLEEAVALAPERPYLRLMLSRWLACGAFPTRPPDGPLIQRAVDAANEAVGADPWDPFARHHRSQVLLQAWQLSHQNELVPTILSDLRAARDIAPRASYWIEAGQACLMVGQVPMARVELEEGRRLADQSNDVPSRALARAWLGNVHAVSGDASSAEKLWLEAIQIAPQQAQTYFALAQFLNRTPPQTQQRILERVPQQIRPTIEQILRQVSRPAPRGR